MAVVQNRALRYLLLGLAWFWIGVAFVGVVLPLIPTTGPVLLAAFLFSLSSERFDNWIATNRYFGGIVRDWREGMGFTVRAKSIAVAAIAMSFAFTTFFALADASLWIRASMWTLALAIASYVVTRPTKRMSSTEGVGALEG